LPASSRLGISAVLNVEGGGTPHLDGGKMRVKLLSAGLTVSLMLFTGFSWGQETTTPKFKISFSERFRIETTDDATSLSNDAGAGSSYTRNRTSIGGVWTPAKPYEFCAKLTNEFRNYFVPESRQFNFDEIFVDQLYFKWKTSSSKPFTATLGRQNITLGEGFVVMDGGPLDGSRSGYFNAARVDWECCPTTKLTAIFVYQQYKDHLLPVINYKDKLMTEQNERAEILYCAKSFGEKNLQAYYIRKDGDLSDYKPYDMSNNTFGARFSDPLGKGISLTLEGDYQFGKLYDYDQKGIAGYGYINWTPEQIKKYPMTLTFGGIYLSGDDPETEDYEGWDPLYGRWPKWSESYIYTLVRESAVAYWTNMISIYSKALVEITPNVKGSLDYHHLMAPEKSNRPIYPGGDGKTRGDLFIGKVAYQLNKKVSGHLLWERFYPGNFYFDNAVPSNWFRMEFMLSM
jgi:hypothetical protein